MADDSPLRFKISPLQCVNEKHLMRFQSELKRLFQIFSSVVYSSGKHSSICFSMLPQIIETVV